jgi:hypothetical protein
MQTLKKGDPDKTVEAKKLQQEKELQESLKHINQIDKRLAETFYAIEADSYAYHQIWKEYFYSVPKEERKFNFVQDPSGRGITIGMIDKRPVVLNLNWWIVNDHPILFYCCTSQVCDWKMIEDWLKKYMPHLKQTSDASNAHNVLNYLGD